MQRQQIISASRRLNIHLKAARGHTILIPTKYEAAGRGRSGSEARTRGREVQISYGYAATAALGKGGRKVENRRSGIRIHQRRRPVSVYRSIV